MAERKIYLDPDINFRKLEDKIFYYPCAGSGDYSEPIYLFRNIVKEFWFVDNRYPDKGPLKPLQINGFSFIRTTIIGSFKFTQEIRYTENGKRYKYDEPCMQKDMYEYQERIITIVRRRGYDFTSLFGPSSLEIAENRLGIFFYRGDSYEGGSNHPWMSNRPVQMIAGNPKVALLSKVIDTLPDGGILATDGSNRQHNNYPKVASDHQYSELFKYCSRNISPLNAYKSVKDFVDSKGNLLSCIGYGRRWNMPTFIWKINKSNRLHSSSNTTYIQSS